MNAMSSLREASVSLGAKRFKLSFLTFNLNADGSSERDEDEPANVGPLQVLMLADRNRVISGYN